MNQKIIFALNHVAQATNFDAQAAQSAETEIRN